MPSRRTTLLGGTFAGLAGRAAAQTARPPDHTVIALVSPDNQPASLLIADQIAARLGGTESGLRTESDGGVLDGVARLVDRDPMAASILPSTTLASMELTGSPAQVSRALRLVGRLGVMAVHVLASQRIGSVEQLAGQSVNLGPLGSATQITASLLLDQAAVRVEPTYLDHAQALSSVQRGQMAAMFFVAPKPATLFADVKQSDGVHFLAMAIPGEVPGGVFPTQIQPHDYPILCAGEAAMGWPIETVGVPLVLGCYAWAPSTEEYLVMARLADRLAKHGSGLPGFDMAAAVPGWQRFWPVSEWLAQGRSGTIAAHAISQRRSLRAKPKSAEPRDVPSSEMKESSEKEQLFRQFLSWRRSL
jgi:hypothetical protein